MNSLLAFTKGEEKGYISITKEESKLIEESGVRDNLEYPPFIDRFKVLKIFRKKITYGDCYCGSELETCSREFNTKLYIFEFKLTQKTGEKWYQPK